MESPTVSSRAVILAMALLLPISLPGCVQTPSTATGLPFNLPPTPVITADVVRGVAPLTVQFNSDRSTDDGLIISRFWDFGDGTTSDEISPRHRFTTTGDFEVTLTLTDEQEAQASRTQTIAVTEAPVAVMSVDPTSAEAAPAVISFDGSASYDPDGEIVEHRWDFGDGSREFLQAVTHVYASPGTFRATLTVTDDKGVTGETAKLVKVGIPTPEIEIRVPPPDVTNIVLTTDSALWIQAVYDLHPGTAHYVRAGIDKDRDQCEAQSVLYNTLTGDPNQVLTGHDDRVNDVAFAPNGETVVAASDDGTVQRYRVSTGELLLPTYGGAGEINAVAFSPDGGQLVWGQSNGDVVLVDVGSGAVVRTFTGHNAAVNDVAFSPNGTQILSGSSDRRALLWNVADGTVLRDFQHELGINAVAISPQDPTVVATGSEDETIKIWNTTGGAELVTLNGHAGPINDLAFSPNGLTLLSASDDETAKAWSPHRGIAVTTYSGHDDAVVAVAVSADGTHVITGSADGTARVWNSVTAETLRTVQPCESTISSVAVSPSGLRFVVGVAARNDIQLDSDPPSGNDLNITQPQGLMLTEVADLNLADVPSGLYYLWAEIDTDQTDVPVRQYANGVVNVVDRFTETISNDTPTIPLVNGAASVVIPADSERQIFDLGTLDWDDRVFISLLTVPGFGEFYTAGDEFSAMILDTQQEIFTWYQSGFILFSPHTKLIVQQKTLQSYVVADGGVSLSIRVQRDSNLASTAARAQRILVRFDGAGAVAAGDQPARPIPPLDAADFNEFFSPPESWGDTQTTQLKTAIMSQLASFYAPYNVVFSRADQDVPPTPPYQTIYIGGSTPDGLLGIADYVDPRNETTTGTAIVFATEIAEQGITGNFSKTISDIGTLGAAIGTVAAHEVGHLLGLRHTDVVDDIMQGDPGWEAADPTLPRVFKTNALVAEAEQLDALPAIGIQNAPRLLEETVGLAGE
jgi:WD40 repeat protein